MNFLRGHKLNRSPFVKNCKMQSNTGKKLRFKSDQLTKFCSKVPFILLLFTLKSSSLIQKKCTAIAVLLEQSKEEHSVIIQNKDAKLEELSRVQDKQAEKLEQSQANIQELQKSLALETQR